jgi:hypothetical protein
MTSTALNQARLYPKVDFTTGLPKPLPAASTVTPTSNFSLADRQGVLNRAGEQVGGFDVTGGVSRASRPPSVLDLKAGARQSYPDLSTLKENGGYVRTPDGRFFIENPLQGSSVSKVPGYAPSTATTSKPFAGGIQGQGGVPSNAANLSGQPVSRPYTDYMSRVGQGAKTALSGTDGLKALYSATEAAAPYASMAGLGGAAGTYAIERQEKAEEAMRNRPKESPGMIRPYEFSYNPTDTAFEPYSGSAERTYFQPSFTALTPYEAPGPEYKKAAEGGLMGYAVGGPVEQMSAMNAIGANAGYPMANINTPVYSNPMMQRPEATNVIAPSADAGVAAYTGEARFAKGGGTVDPQNQSSGYEYAYDPKTMQFTQTGGPKTAPPPSASRTIMGNLIPSALAQGANQPQNVTPDGTVSGGIATPVRQPTSPAQPFVPNIDIPAYQTPEQQLGLGGFYDYMNQQMGSYGGYAAGGGVSTLGDYSDGGRLLKGPGDGVSDSIPASIGNRQPARLADGEFVVPARIVSEIGNGSTEAGARKLYAMMDRVQNARRKTVGKNQVARNTKADKLLPA